MKRSPDRVETQPQLGERKKKQSPGRVGKKKKTSNQNQSISFGLCLPIQSQLTRLPPDPREQLPPVALRPRLRLLLPVAVAPSACHVPAASSVISHREFFVQTGL